MIGRRDFLAGLGAAAGIVRLMPEAAYAQRAAPAGRQTRDDTVWLNANENPAGPPEVSLAAMRDSLPESGRYHFQEFREIEAAIARSLQLESGQVLTGGGSSEILHYVVDAFTSATLPLIAPNPTFEGPADVARAMGRPVVLTALRPDYSADVHALAEAAQRARGGLIYLCNPNNPTSTITNRKDLQWLVANLPPGAALVVDEAYIEFGQTPDLESALAYVRQGKDVIVTRTFSKIYGMAGLRVGFGAAKPELIARMRPLRMGVISIVSARAAAAAIDNRDAILTERRAAAAHTRRGLCEWLRERKVGFIEPHANFIMIDTGRNVREFASSMQRLGVVPGRPFPPLDNLLRVTIGTDAEMAKFREVFWKVYRA